MLSALHRACDSGLRSWELGGLLAQTVSRVRVASGGRGQSAGRAWADSNAGSSLADGVFVPPRPMSCGMLRQGYAMGSPADADSGAGPCSAPSSHDLLHKLSGAPLVHAAPPASFLPTTSDDKKSISDLFRVLAESRFLGQRPENIRRFLC